MSLKISNGLWPVVPLEESPRKRVLGPLFIISLASLYLELLLIRWVGTEVRVFAYFQNLTLLTCFLGFAVGMYRATARKSGLFDAAALGILIVLVSLPFLPWKALLEVMSAALSFSADSQVWSAVFPAGISQSGVAVVSVLLVGGLLALIAAVMVPLGQWVGTYLDAAPNLVSAYTVNLFGSLAGIWLFALVSYLRLSPVYWFGLALLLFAAVSPPVRKSSLIRGLSLAGALLLLGYAGLNTNVRWSPYQKLELHPLSHGQYNLFVNNTGYMTLANLTPSYLRENADLRAKYRESSYDTPFRFVGSRENVLVVGAGAGNDVDAALRNGAAHVDAVEIDPVIYGIGKSLHPDKPYDSSRVRVVIGDARTYLRNSKARYDVVVFGLLDSHTEFSGYSNMRIDNYVYTDESLRDAKRLLKPSGALILKFEVRAPWTWMGERFYSMLNDIFGRAPVIFFAQPVGGMLSATEFIASNDLTVWDRATSPDLAAIIRSHPVAFPINATLPPSPTTDDWPYVYQRNHRIPRTYLVISLILLIIAAIALRSGFRPRKIATWTFFFLGAGFLLLETQMISRLALYFGATWWVNCFAISVLLLVLVGSNIYVQIGAPRPPVLLYGFVFLTLIGIYAVQWAAIPLSNHTVGILLAMAYSLPVFSAGIIFTEAFRQSSRKSEALGGNIMGAIAGGLAQNLSFVFGLRSLLLLAAAFYALAGICAIAPDLRLSRNIAAQRG